MVQSSGRLELLRSITTEVERAGDVISLWAEVLTDPGLIREAFHRDAVPGLSDAELAWCHSYCTRRCSEIVTHREERLDRERDGEAPSEEESDHDHGIDGASEKEVYLLDREDDALLLHAYQRLVGPLRSKKRHAEIYQHAFVDEAQDLSPVEMSVVLDTVAGYAGDKSVTFAGDVAQRLHMDNGFTDWRTVLAQLGLSHVEIEPLKLAYRSTAPIIEFATDILGHLRNEVTGQAIRGGAPVELFRFGGSGEAVGFLSEALRNLALSEPLASVCVITRFPEQADEYHEGLRRGEVPNLRRIAPAGLPVPRGRGCHRRAPGEGPRVRLRGAGGVQHHHVSGGRRGAPPAAHRGHARGAPAVGDVQRDALHAAPRGAARRGQLRHRHGARAHVHALRPRVDPARGRAPHRHGQAGRHVQPERAPRGTRRRAPPARALSRRA
jgi:hypothetical protein